jgi:hypothetical protein
VYFGRKTSAGRAYLQIVESRRDGDQVRQQVIATLGRYEELQQSGDVQPQHCPNGAVGGKPCVSGVGIISGSRLRERRSGVVARLGWIGVELRRPRGIDPRPSISAPRVEEGWRLVQV